MTPAVGYTEMKESGIEWVGRIPAHWMLRRIKTLATEKDSLFIDGDWINAQDISESGIRYLTTGNIGQGIFKEQGEGYISEETFERLRCLEVHAGDLVVSRLNTPVGRACIIPVKYRRCVVAVDNVVLRPDKVYHKRFLMYCMSSDRYAEFTQLLARGTTMQRISRTQLGNICLPIPPYEEQLAIAAYLDTQCAKIDEIIAEAKASIEDYKQWKASIIYEAVTKGLDPKAEMKDSGIEWIGEIPMGWEIKKAKKCVTITNGADPKTEGNIPVYGSGAESFKTCGEYKEGPTVLIGRKGATLHIPHYITGRYWNVDTAFDAKAKVGFSLKYYYFLAYSFDYKYYISQTTLPSMTQTNYNNIFLPVPPKETQDLISRVLSTRIEKIDAYIDERKSLVTDLESYKKSLIYEVVTGKRRVC